MPIPFESFLILKFHIIEKIKSIFFFKVSIKDKIIIVKFLTFRGDEKILRLVNMNTTYYISLIHLGDYIIIIMVSQI